MTEVKTYRPDIDGLRAVAVSGVLLFHAFPQAFPAGFLGVDVFFVISGYLISGILMRALIDERFSLKEFYIARIKRIFPSLLLVLGLVALVGWFYLLPEEFSQLGRHIAGGGAFVANILYWGESGYLTSRLLVSPCCISGHWASRSSFILCSQWCFLSFIDRSGAFPL